VSEYINPERVRTIALSLVEGKVEHGKVDFKRAFAVTTAEEKSEFCKDLSAIANTDDDRLEGYGFIVLGAEPGNLVGGIGAWASGKLDNFSAALTTIAKGYLAPLPIFSLMAFEDQDVGHWGVIVIPPSSNQPHIFIREHAGNPSKHEWFVRLNDTTEKAGALDYARVLQKAIHRSTRPLEAEVQRLALKLELAEDARVSSASFLAALGNLKSKDAQQDLGDARGRLQELPALLRRELSTQESRAEDLLAEEALGVRALMLDARPENPTRSNSNDPAEPLRAIDYMEGQTRRFAEAIATIARYDSGLRYSAAVADAFDIIAEQPQIVSPFWDNAEDMRLYPLVLAIYALAVVAAARQDGRLLRRVLDCECRLWRNDEVVPLIWAVHTNRNAFGIFNWAMRAVQFQPIAQRMLTIIPAWCAPLIPGKDAERCFYQAEFALALEHMRLDTPLDGRGTPLAGAYLYAAKGEAAVLGMLRRGSPLLEALFGDKVEALLMEFDRNITRVVHRDAYQRNFSKKKVASAWRRRGTEEEGAG
jgi:hypothetical protein